MTFDKEKTKDKFIGSLAGFAIGDAMGATTEFMTKKDIKQKYGFVDDIIGGGWLNLKPGEVTDDTQMMRCVINAFMKYEGKLSPGKFKDAVMLEFIEWYSMGPVDVGGACARGIEHYMSTGQYIGDVPDSLGNGGLMRALPCCLMGSKKLNYAQNNITHNNAMCRSFIEKYHELMEYVFYTPLEEGFKSSKAFMVNPTGKVSDTFYCAKHWSLAADNFEQAITGPVNQGGDADTIAALSGSIAGMRFGLGKIPYKWLDKIDSELMGLFFRFAEKAVDDMYR